MLFHEDYKLQFDALAGVSIPLGKLVTRAEGMVIPLEGCHVAYHQDGEDFEEKLMGGLPSVLGIAVNYDVQTLRRQAANAVDEIFSAMGDYSRLRSKPEDKFPSDYSYDVLNFRMRYARHTSPWGGKPYMRHVRIGGIEGAPFDGLTADQLLVNWQPEEGRRRSFNVVRIGETSILGTMYDRSVSFVRDFITKCHAAFPGKESLIDALVYGSFNVRVLPVMITELINDSTDPDRVALAERLRQEALTTHGNFGQSKQIAITRLDRKSIASVQRVLDTF